MQKLHINRNFSLVTKNSCFAGMPDTFIGMSVKFIELSFLLLVIVKKMPLGRLE